MTDTDTGPEPAGRPSALAQLGNLFVAPASALDYADRHPGMWWLPLGVTLAANAVLGLWIAFTMNLAAWRAMMVHLVSKSHPEAAAHYAHAGRGYLVLGAVIGIVAIAVIELIYALYLFLADKLFSADSRGYGRWFSFTAWTWLPITLAYIAGIIAWAVSSHGVGMHMADITSLNALFFHLSPHNSLFKLAQFSILQFWVIGLVTYGLVRWCRHGTGKALAVALAPYVVVYGIVYLV